MTGLKRDKKSFILLFSVELWERWAFYGLQALLILFFVQHLGFRCGDGSDNGYGYG